jgi:hypothetical protein
MGDMSRAFFNFFVRHQKFMDCAAGESSPASGDPGGPILINENEVSRCPLERERDPAAGDAVSCPR